MKPSGHKIVTISWMHLKVKGSEQLSRSCIGLRDGTKYHSCLFILFGKNVLTIKYYSCDYDAVL